MKRLEVVLDALSLATAPVALHAFGPDGPDGYREELERRAEELGVHARFAGPVPFAQVPPLYAGHDAVVSNTRGGADKVVLEGAASCRPVLASSLAFTQLLDGLDLRYEGAEELAARLERLAAASAEERERLGRTLRERVERSHSVDSWADAIIGFAER